MLVSDYFQLQTFVHGLKNKTKGTFCDYLMAANNPSFNRNKGTAL